MTVGGGIWWSRSDRGLGGRNSASSRAWLSWFSERLCVGEAVRAARDFRSSGVPGQQRDVLQMVRPATYGCDKGLRCGNVVLRVRIGGFEKKVRRGRARTAATAFIARAHPNGK